MNTKIEGKCYLCGDAVTVYQIIPEKRWTMNRMDAAEMSRWVFETMEPGAEDVPGLFRSLGYEIVVAGRDFGCGSKSVEHPVAALQGAGIRLVLADSFSRYSYRNALNLGLPVLTCPGILEAVRRDDVLSVDIRTGAVRNLTTGRTLQAEGLSDFALSLISAGGLLPYLEKEANSHE